jgi:hypothetical protein
MIVVVVTQLVLFMALAHPTADRVDDDRDREDPPEQAIPTSDGLDPPAEMTVALPPRESWGFAGRQP